MLQNHWNGGELNETIKQSFTRGDPNGRWKGSFIQDKSGSIGQSNKINVWATGVDIPMREAKITVKSVKHKKCME